jgi:hypothetical protein
MPVEYRKFVAGMSKTASRYRWKLAYDGSTGANDYLLVAKRSHQLGLRAHFKP